MAAWSAAMHEAFIGNAPDAVVGCVANFTPHEALFLIRTASDCVGVAAVHDASDPLDELSRWERAEAASAALTRSVGAPIRCIPCSVGPENGTMAWRSDCNTASVTWLPGETWVLGAPPPPPPADSHANVWFQLPAFAEDGALVVSPSIEAVLELDGWCVRGELSIDDDTMSFVPATFAAPPTPSAAVFEGTVASNENGAWQLQIATAGTARWANVEADARFCKLGSETAIAVELGPAVSFERSGASRSFVEGETTVEIRR